MESVGSRRLTPKSEKSACYPILRIQSRENMGEDLKISKTDMADRWVLVQVKKYIDRLWDMWDNLISDRLDVGLHSPNFSGV